MDGETSGGVVLVGILFGGWEVSDTKLFVTYSGHPPRLFDRLICAIKVIFWNPEIDFELSFWCYRKNWWVGKK